MCPLDTKDHFNYSIYCTDPFSKYWTRLGQKLTLQYLVYVRPLFRVQRQARMWRKKSTPYTSVHLLRRKKKYTSRLRPSTTVGAPLSRFNPVISDWPHQSDSTNTKGHCCFFICLRRTWTHGERPGRNSLVGKRIPIHYLFSLKNSKVFFSISPNGRVTSSLAFASFCSFSHHMSYRLIVELLWSFPNHLCMLATVNDYLRYGRRQTEAFCEFFVELCVATVEIVLRFEAHMRSFFEAHLRFFAGKIDTSRKPGPSLGLHVIII